MRRSSETNSRDHLPFVSGEGILRFNPEVIIEMIPHMEKNGWDEQMILRDWDKLKRVDAVKNKRVYVFGQDYMIVPGPRFILIVEALARVLHPELIWEAS